MKKIVRSVASSWIAHKNTSTSAAIAFYTVFSITPLLAIGVGAAGLFISRASAQNEIVAQVARLASPEAAAIVRTVLLNFRIETTGTFASVVLLMLMIYSASMVFEELRTALNRIFGVKKHETAKDQLYVFVRGRVISGIFAFSAGFLAVANLFISTFLTVFEKMIQYFPDSTRKMSFYWISFLNQSISFLVVFIIFFCFFRFLPQKRPSFRNMIPGIMLSAFLFESGKYLLKLYLTKTTLASSFGAGGTLVAAIVWVYYSVQIILLGAEVSNYMENLAMHRYPASVRRRMRRESSGQ